MSDQGLRRQDTYSAFMAARTRGTILMVLSAIPSEIASASGLRAMIGDEAVHVGVVEIEAAMRWLGKAGYVLLSERAGELVVEITDRGIDVVERREIDDGVTLPRRRAR
ncbi:MAG: hypothetical protein PHS60_12555 [Zavarzinia sp.]|nr:hypothetical protein [Zavarzinia sp.]